MSTETAPNSYLRTKVMTASPAELRLMLFDGAVKFAEQAKAGFETKDHEAVYNGTVRCQNILMELLNALRPEHDRELCERLSALYTFMFTQMMNATTEQNPAMIDEVLDLLRYERETWRLLLEQLANENRAASRLDETPDSAPTIPPTETPTDIVGGSVSMTG
jgi:flagellar protein FliS